MSIYATWLSIEHPDQWIAKLEEKGVNAGILGDTSDEFELGSPLIYQGSHVLPAEDDPRGGLVSVAAIPDFITREGRDDGKEGLHDFLRLDVMEDPKTYGEPQSGFATVVLNRAQVESLRNTLTEWLEAEERF